MTPPAKLSAKPEVQLVGHDGNAYSILGRCLAAARAAGWSRERVAQTSERLKNAGGYDEFLRAVMEEFDVR